jgi:CheY-like chemotaxis protein
MDASEAARLAGEIGAVALLVDQPLLDEELPGDLPVISLPWLGTRATAVALGGRDLISRPVTPRQLLAAVDRLVSSAPPRKVLVAAGDPDLVRLFRRILRARWAWPDLLEAYNGEEALELITTEQPGLIILDLDLPGQGGRGVMARLHSPDGEPNHLADIPVILIAEADKEELDLPLARPLEVARRGGLRLGEASRVLKGILEVLQG